MSPKKSPGGTKRSADAGSKSANKAGGKVTGNAAGKAAGKTGGRSGNKTGGKAAPGRSSGAKRTSADSGTKGKGKSEGKSTSKPKGQWRRYGDGPLADPGALLFKVGLEHGSDLAHFLQDAVPGKLSVRKVRRALEEGRCRVNGKIETFGSRKVYRNDLISFVAPTKAEVRHRFAFEADRVLYAEHDVIVYDKPPGLPVTPTDAGTGPSLIGILRRDLGDLLACHRIDADTSGAVLLARTRERQQQYEEAFRDHLVKKRYLALVRGRPPKGGTHRTGLLLVEQSTGIERWASGKGQGALLAITRWQLLSPVGRKAALVSVEPRTGRTHQIRVHFSELGFPLLGDRVYGDRKDPIHVSRHLLHAETLTAPHPTESGTFSVTAPRPADFQSAIDQLQAL